MGAPLVPLLLTFQFVRRVVHKTESALAASTQIERPTSTANHRANPRCLPFSSCLSLASVWSPFWSFLWKVLKYVNRAKAAICCLQYSVKLSSQEKTKWKAKNASETFTSRQFSGPESPGFIGRWAGQLDVSSHIYTSANLSKGVVKRKIPLCNSTFAMHTIMDLREFEEPHVECKLEKKGFSRLDSHAALLGYFCVNWAKKG